jgi:hypothetical protein
VIQSDSREFLCLLLCRVFLTKDVVLQRAAAVDVVIGCRHVGFFFPKIDNQIKTLKSRLALHYLSQAVRRSRPSGRRQPM